MSGTVVRGDARGRLLGFPTANLEISHRKMIPQDGIYFAHVHLNGTTAYAMVSIGVRPTFFTQGQRIVEANILDFDGDLYGDVITLQFLNRLRDERKFGSAEELVEQMRIDERQSRKLEAEYRSKARKQNNTR